MQKLIRGRGRRISKAKSGRPQVAAAAWYTAERLEDRILLTTYFVNFTNGPASNTNAHTPPVDVPGYMTDIGQPFGDRTDRGNPGVSYGWVDPITGAPKDDQVNGRNRDVATSPDERYDSFNHMMKPSNTDQSGWAHWEIAIPNGQYQVRIVSGDISNVNSHFILTAEGQVILDGIPTAATALSHFVDQTGIATVADGRLTIGNGTGAENNKIAFIEISDQSSVTTPK